MISPVGGELAYLHLPTLPQEMKMVCYRVRIAYLVNVLQAKGATAQPLVRFVGADPACRDLPVPLEVAKRYLTASANDAFSLGTGLAA